MLNPGETQTGLCKKSTCVNAFLQKIHVQQNTRKAFVLAHVP